MNQCLQCVGFQANDEIESTNMWKKYEDFDVEYGTTLSSRNAGFHTFSCNSWRYIGVKHPTYDIKHAIKSISPGSFSIWNRNLLKTFQLQTRNINYWKLSIRILLFNRLMPTYCFTPEPRHQTTRQIDSKSCSLGFNFQVCFFCDGCLKFPLNWVQTWFDTLRK